MLRMEMLEALEPEVILDVLSYAITDFILTFQKHDRNKIFYHIQ